MAQDDAVTADRVFGLCERGRFAMAHSLVDDGFVARNGSFGYLVRARVFAYERRADRAREAVDWALAHAERGDPDPPLLAGLVLLMLGDAHAALGLGLRVAAADPREWRAQVLVADACRMLSRGPEAVAAARRAVLIAPREAEAQVALARALDLSIRPAARAERRTVVARALELGAAPADVAGRRRWPRVVPVLLVAALVLSASPKVLAGGVGVLAALAGALWLLQARRSGSTGRGRLQTVRALARAELNGDPARARAAALTVAAHLAVLPIAATGLAAAAAADGTPWPLPAVLGVAAGAVVVLVGAARAVRWWYGDAFLRRDFLPSRHAVLQLTAVVALIGTVVALSVAQATSTALWSAVTVSHLLWCVVGGLIPVLALYRARRAGG
ncbi:hypothetical protein OG539_18060 [Actinacidiphila glaucinigra]|uniref:hypothetical protein n=1 Tax=Actinacidiphila glaucinigra TaxID=235986 RepID=UPI0032454931